MRTLQYILTFALFPITVYGQESINPTFLIKNNHIKICKAYSIDYPDSISELPNEKSISFIQNYDSFGRLVKHIEPDYDYSKEDFIIKRLYSYQYIGNTSIEIYVDSVSDFTRVTTTVVDSIQNKTSETQYYNNKFKYKYNLFHDNNGRKISREVFNEDGTLKYSYTYDYIFDSLNNSTSLFVKGKIKEKIENLSPTSRVYTSYDENEEVIDKVFQNLTEDDRVKEFCQIVFNDIDTDLGFFCVERQFDSYNRLVRENYLQSHRYELFKYNDLGLLIQHEIFNNDGIIALSIYKYE